MTPKLWALVALAAAAVLAWVFRYETVPVSARPVPAAYLVNRWTGTTYLVRGSTVYEVKPATPKMGLFDDVLEPEAGANPP